MTKGNHLTIRVFDINKNKMIKVSLEDYVLQVLAYEIHENFHMEVLKAHAMIIRTYLIRKMKLFDGRGCSVHRGADLCNDPSHCLGAMAIEDIKGQGKNNLERAVKDTEGKVITFKNRMIIPYYHNTCGGATQNAENVFGNMVGYARKVLCEYCKSTSPHWQSTIDFSLEELEDLLNIKFHPFNALQGPNMDKIIDQVERDEDGRVIHLKIGNKVIKGTQFQEKLGLPSSRFGWQPTRMRFFVQGKGHGVGLCQYGAQGLAIQGKKAEEIIKYYFTGVEVEKIPHWSINSPLEGKIILIDPGHGGKDIGIVRNNIIEKDINFKIALSLKELLEKAGSEVILTRNRDEYIPLAERWEISRSINPHFILSIHGNDNPAFKEDTTQIYVYPGDREAHQLGKHIAEEFKNQGIPIRGVAEADLYMTRECGKSTLVIDLGYFSFKEDIWNKMVQCIYKGLLSYWGIDNG